jgi:hypothetical protein
LISSRPPALLLGLLGRASRTRIRKDPNDEFSVFGFDRRRLCRSLGAFEPMPPKSRSRPSCSPTVGRSVREARQLCIGVVGEVSCRHRRSIPTFPLTATTTVGIQYRPLSTTELSSRWRRVTRTPSNLYQSYTKPNPNPTNMLGLILRIADDVTCGQLFSHPHHFTCFFTVAHFSVTAQCSSCSRTMVPLQACAPRTSHIRVQIRRRLY